MSVPDRAASFVVSRSEAENILTFFLSLAELVWNEVSVQVISDGHGPGLQ